jgi:hypothetical protein
MVLALTDAAVVLVAFTLIALLGYLMDRQVDSSDRK